MGSEAVYLDSSKVAVASAEVTATDLARSVLFRVDALNLEVRFTFGENASTEISDPDAVAGIEIVSLAPQRPQSLFIRVKLIADQSQTIAAAWSSSDGVTIEKPTLTVE